MNMADIESALSRGKKEHALFTDVEIDVVSVDDNDRTGYDVCDKSGTDPNWQKSRSVYVKCVF